MKKKLKSLEPVTNNFEFKGLTSKNLQEYVSTHGKDRLQGYQDALTEILPYLYNQVLTHKNFFNNRKTILSNTDRTVHSNLIKFYKERLSFLENDLSQKQAEFESSNNGNDYKLKL